MQEQIKIVEEKMTKICRCFHKKGSHHAVINKKNRINYYYSCKIKDCECKKFEPQDELHKGSRKLCPKCNPKRNRNLK